MYVRYKKIDRLPKNNNFIKDINNYSTTILTTKSKKKGENLFRFSPFITDLDETDTNYNL
jgi:hypothetical protein